MLYYPEWKNKSTRRFFQMNKLLAASALCLALMVPASLTQAAAKANLLVAGQMCADKLYNNAHGKSAAELLQKMNTLVNVDHVIASAAAINGVTLTPDVIAKYKEGMTDFAEHFVIPQLAKELRHAPHITVVTTHGKTLVISEDDSASLTVEQRSCRILNVNHGDSSLIGMFSKHVKDNFS
jgi:hypothetical protein